MPQDPLQEQRKKLLKFGLTSQEVDLWFALAEVAGQMLQLPVLHPTEREEAAHDFHKLQNRILARAGLRAMGWKEQ